MERTMNENQIDIFMQKLIRALREQKDGTVTISAEEATALVFMLDKLKKISELMRGVVKD